MQLGLLTILELQNISFKYENKYENIYKFGMHILRILLIPL